MGQTINHTQRGRHHPCATQLHHRQEERGGGVTKRDDENAEERGARWSEWSFAGETTVAVGLLQWWLIVVEI